MNKISSYNNQDQKNKWHLKLVMVWSKQNTHTFLVWVNDSTAIWISVCWYLRKMGINLPQDETIALLGSYPNDTLYYYRNTCSNTFIATKFFIARLWKQSICHQLITRQEMWYICAIEYYSTIKNKIKKCADKWMKWGKLSHWGDQDPERQMWYIFTYVDICY